MGNIVLLDDLTINKIAAGEVIERPASVVKEMVENSIDAGAKNITVEIKNGGIALIKITDDGCGIAEDDMEIAFERHATSKIRTADDLQDIMTMGFRGEALASVAAISRVEMVSKKADEPAHKIVVEGGKTLEFTEAARNVGTTITVENLFYNTPVRYKFLKKDYTESGYIEDIVTRLALVNKDIAFKLISNGKTIIQTNGSGDMKSIIYSIYGKDVAEEIVEVNYEFDDMLVSGVVGKAVIARANRSNQLFFVNSRYVKDKNLSAAADQAFKGIVPVGRYGFLVLDIIMNPKEVDVNVHPAKLEVRFADEGKVFKAVYHAIKSSLEQAVIFNNEPKQDTKQIENQTNIIDSLNNIKVDEKAFNIGSDYNDIPEEKEEHKKGFMGLFKKKNKEDEEENVLEEIYNARKHGIKSFTNNDDFTPVTDEEDEFGEEELKVAEETPIASEEKEVKDESKEVFASAGDAYSFPEEKDAKKEVEPEEDDMTSIENLISTSASKMGKESHLDSYIDALKKQLSNRIKENPEIASELSKMNKEIKLDVSAEASKEEVKPVEKVEKIEKVEEVEEPEEIKSNTTVSSDTIVVEKYNKDLKEAFDEISSNVDTVENTIKAIADEDDEEFENPYGGKISKVFTDEELDSPDRKEETELEKAFNTGVINDSEVSKTIMYGDAKISSETKEIDVTTVNNLIKDATTEMLSTKMQNAQPTTTVETSEVMAGLTSMDHTQAIGAEETSDDTNSVLNNNSFAGMNIDPDNLTRQIPLVNADENITVNVSKETGNDETNTDFSKIAEQLVEAKLSVENTQMVDTNKIREAMKEANFGANKPEEEVAFDQMYKKTFGVDPYSVRKEKEAEKQEEEKANATNDFSQVTENMNVFEENEEELPKQKNIIPYRYVGNAFDTYMIIEIKDELYIIDQRAANERIIFENIKNSYYDESQRDEQFLLLPDVIQLTNKQLILANENIPMFAQAGFSFEEFGDNTIKLVSVPGICEQLNTKKLFTDILDVLDKVAITDTKEKEEKFLSIIAESTADKIPMRTNVEEIKFLLDDLLSIDNPFSYIYGKTTAIKMSRYDLERKFSRK